MKMKESNMINGVCKPMIINGINWKRNIMKMIMICEWY